MRTLIIVVAALSVTACASARPARTTLVAPTVTVQVENRSRCAVRVKVEQASTLVGNARVNAQSTASFKLQERHAGPVTYTVEPEQRCGVKPYVIGTALFSESATLKLQDDPGLSMFKAGEPQ